MQLPNLRHLEVFREVARRGGVSAAARAVHLTQPAVTQAVAGLERAFGGTLFARGSTGVVATPAGQAALARVERALELLRDGLGEVRPARFREITAAQLEALVAVADAGGVGRAARTAARSRATLHRAVRQLEATLAVDLFEATSHGLRPTREAERLARHAQLAAAELAQARAEVAAATGADAGAGGWGATVIGAMPLARSALVPAAVLEFAAARPAHAISILDGPYESMLDALRRGRADVLVGALRDAPPDDVLQEHLFDDPLAIVVRAGHPLAMRSAPPTARDLSSYPWIAPRAGSPLRRHFEALRARAGRDAPAAAVECNSLVAARALLLASDRVMLSSAHQVGHELAAGEFAVLPHPLGRVVRAIGLTTRRGWRPTEAQATLLGALRRHARGAALDPGPGPGTPTAPAAPSRPRNRRGRGTRAATAPSGG